MSASGPVRRGPGLVGRGGDAPAEAPRRPAGLLAVPAGGSGGGAARGAVTRERATPSRSCPVRAALATPAAFDLSASVRPRTPEDRATSPRRPPLIHSGDSFLSRTRALPRPVRTQSAVPRRFARGLSAQIAIGHGVTRLNSADGDPDPSFLSSFQRLQYPRESSRQRHGPCPIPTAQASLHRPWLGEPCSRCQRPPAPGPCPGRRPGSAGASSARPRCAGR